MDNLGRLLTGGSILWLSTKIRVVIQDLLDRDLDEGLLGTLRWRGRWVLEECTPSS